MNERPNNRTHDKEVERRRDESIKRALKTPPTRLKDIPKKRKKKASPPSGGGGKP